ncbi:GNAT family N-acetyltransferase [Persicimonas caeni]|uniref:GNAT family N-acetyltransferase n=1 Tax=Persicimonas caeni TaxID=2292766 RepID=A0A4Y6PZ67_PERCE|nr:GNAT family N-acetyltransferase [Persicimonas caeni]QDG53602.1 GNAT family N-acetyltransferase [Persicimonas caeni]QED34823.1 GNAT family N-acetyltransferase [Persicimonas caeni]
MNELVKVTAFVVTADEPHHLLVFGHPTAGLQLPAGTVEPGETPIAAAKREVWEETGLEVASRGVVLCEQLSELGPDLAVMLETVASDGITFRRGHHVKVLAHDQAREAARIREEILDYNTTPPEVISATEGDVPVAALAHRIRRHFVLFVEPVQRAAPWVRRADGHDFEVRWTRLSEDIPLVEGLKSQKAWLKSNFARLRACLSAALDSRIKLNLADDPDHIDACERILRELPAWFGIEEAIVEYVEQIAELPTFLARSRGEIVGFLSVEQHSAAAAEIIVMGVAESHHRRGVGRALVEAAEAHLRDRGVRFLQVKTLSEAHPSPEYARTREFYRAVGFEPLEEFPTLWDERNPCLQMVKWLG